MPPLALALRVVPAALALVEVGVVLAILHLALSETMRARGYAAWRVRDTALTVPLLLVALAVAFGGQVPWRPDYYAERRAFEFVAGMGCDAPALVQRAG